MRFLFPVLVVFSLARMALACSCAPGFTPQKAAAQAAAIFLGKAEKVVPPSSAQPFGEVQVKFKVDRFWKGLTSRHVVVGTWSQSAMCGYGFREGDNYLVYAHIDSQGKLQTNLCSRTRLEVDADEDLAVLGEGTVPSAPEPDAFFDALLAAN